MTPRISFRWTHSPGHSRLHVWVNGGKAGELIVRNNGPDERDALVIVERALVEAGATCPDGSTSAVLTTAARGDS